MSDTAKGHKMSLDTQLERLEEVLKEKPDDPNVLMHFGELSLRRGRRLVALLAFQKVAAMKPDVLEVHLDLAKIYGFQKMYNEAYDEMLEALKLESRSVEARILYDILTRETPPSPEVAQRFQEYFSTPHKADEVAVYLQQLNIEKESLSADIQELSRFLESSPLDTILEYNRNMAARRLKLIEELLEKARKLESREAVATQTDGKPAAEEEAGPPQVEIPQEKEKIAESPPAVEAEVEAVIPATNFEPVEEAAPLPSAAASDKKEIIQSLRESLDPLLQSFKKTRGIVAVVAFHANGELVHAIQDDTIDFPEVVRLFSRCLDSLLPFSPNLAYWVTEFEHGVMVLQSIAPKLFFCVIGDASASFGSLRFQMDKNRPLFADALKQVNLPGLG